MVLDSGMNLQKSAGGGDFATWVARLDRAQTIILPAALLIVSARELWKGPALPMCSIHLLALILARYAAKRLTPSALAAIGASLVAGGGAFFLNEIVSPRGFCSGCDDRAWGNVALLFAGYGLATLDFLLRPASVPARLALLGSLCVPLVQAGLLIATPKLCFACAAAGTANVLAAAWIQSVCPSESPRQRRAFLVPSVAIAALVFAGSFVARPVAPKASRMTKLVGLSSQTVGLGPSTAPYQIVLLALPGCHWCGGARQWLSSHRMAVREENLRDAKFAGSPVDTSFAPQLLVLRHGIVTQHIPGLNVDEYEHLKEQP